jgi:hypothetical protein
MKDRRKGITANEDSIIFEIKIKKECLNTYFKLDSDIYSAFPNENEILLSPFNRYLYVTSKELTKEELSEFIENDPDNNYNAFEEVYLQRGINMGYFLVLPPDFNSDLNANDIKQIIKEHIPFGSNKGSLFGYNDDPVILTKNRTPKEHHIVNHFKKLIN